MFSLKEEDKKWIDNIWDKLDLKLSGVSVRSYDKIPYTTIDGVHDDNKELIYRWTNGFWPGLMWLMYVGTKRECYKNTAIHAEELLDEALKLPDFLSHDVGFMWQISSGVNYMLHGDEKSKRRVLTAANALFARFNIRGGFIRAWNSKEREGQAIIDCMMNLPLLYHASKICGDERYAHVAIAHADKTMETHLRCDGSVNHVVKIDQNTGDITGYPEGQGFLPTSSWSRGQAWAIYGYVLSYIHTGDEKYLNASKKTAHYFISNILDDYVSRVDFRAEADDKDTTAAACAACGLIEIARVSDGKEAKIYLDVALKILKALYEDYCDFTDSDDGILQNGVEKYFPEEIRKGHNIIYGDYYFAEAIYKLKGFEPLFW